MNEAPEGSIAVIFVSLRTAADQEGYAAAAAEMEAAVSAMPGYLGMDSARGEDGVGITVSYWRDHQRHRDIRAEGKAHWYDWYRTIVTRVDRSYAWRK